LPNQQCFRCRDQTWKFSRVFTLGPYRGVLREAVIRCKKRRYEPLRYGIGGLLGQVIRDGLAEDDYPADLPQPWLVPVPYHWTHSMDGAANTTASLAAAIGRHASLPVKTGLIARIRKTSKQGMLSWSERKANVRGAFAVRQARILIGRHVLLVDDVLTSGATAAELSSQMLKAGAARVSVVVVARATGTKEQSANHNSKGGQSAGVI
jgi:predicted amidophosphoribosyltransferase